jgi:hypothetical protein
LKKKLKKSSFSGGGGGMMKITSFWFFFNASRLFDSFSPYSYRFKAGKNKKNIEKFLKLNFF